MDPIEKLSILYLASLEAATGLSVAAGATGRKSLGSIMEEQNVLNEWEIETFCILTTALQRLMNR